MEGKHSLGLAELCVFVGGGGRGRAGAYSKVRQLVRSEAPHELAYSLTQQLLGRVRNRLSWSINIILIIGNPALHPRRPQNVAMAIVPQMNGMISKQDVDTTTRLLAYAGGSDSFFDLLFLLHFFTLHQYINYETNFEFWKLENE